MIQCNRCNLQYIGETKRRLKDRFNEHRRTIDNPNYSILLPASKVGVIIYADASTKGWGAVKDAEKIGGMWSDEDEKFHISRLELVAAFFEQGTHFQIYSDNSTTVS